MVGLKKNTVSVYFSVSPLGRNMCFARTARFIVVQDEHLLRKIENKEWWEDRGRRIGRVGEWLFLCSSSNSKMFPPSVVVIIGRVAFQEMTDGHYGPETVRTHLREVRIVSVPVGRSVGQALGVEAVSCPRLLACARRILVLYTHH